MRVLIVSQYFWPEQFRVNEIGKILLQKGHIVEVLTGIPNYPEGKVFKEFLEDKKKFKNYLGIKIYRVPIIRRKDSSPVNLFINYLSFVLSAIIIGTYKLRKKKYDIIFTFGTSPITVALPSIFFSFIKNAKHVLWVLDIWPYILKEINIIKNKYLFYMVTKITMFIYSKTDIILAQSKSFQKIISTDTQDSNKVIYFPSWSETLKNVSKLSDNNNLGFNLDKNVFNIVFTGNIGQAQNFDNIIKAAEILKDEDNIQWIIIGSGRKLEDIKKLIQIKKIKNFKIIGNKPINEILYYHKIANVLLVSLAPGKFLSYTIPGKVQTYMQSNKFILGFISGETKRILVESKAGIAVDPSNPKLLAKTIMKLKNKPEIINRIVMNNYGPEYVKKNYDKKKLLNKLEFNFKNIIEEFRIVKNIKNIPLDKNFSLSGLNLAFLGYWVKKKIRITKDTYLWSDGFFYKRFFKSKDLNKIPGRDIINNINFPNTIKRIFIIGNLEIKSKTHLENLYKKKIIHIPLGQGSAQQLYKNIPNIKFLETDVIYLTLPTPKQEEFADLIMKNNNFYKIFCIGGAINIASGVEKQVPLILEKFNLEFIWRLRTDTFRRLKRLVVSGLSYFKGEFTFKFININKKILNEK